MTFFSPFIFIRSNLEWQSCVPEKVETARMLGMRVLFSVIFLIIHARTPLSLFAMPVIPISVASAHSRYNTHEETLVFISVRRNSVADMKLPADVFLLRVLQISRCLSLGNVMVHVDPAFFRTDASFLSISLLLQKRERQREKDEKLKRKKF